MKRNILLGLLMLTAAAARATTYEIDPDHSSVEFKVRHVVGKVRGRFEQFTGTFDYDAKDASKDKAVAEIDAASINTNVKPRDNDLRSDHFFDVKNCPKLSFKSTKIAFDPQGKGKMEGELTMHCVTKPVTMDVTINGEGADPWGNVRLAASASTTVNRKDWGLTWNKALETGGFLVGDDVEITLEIEGMPKQAEKPAKK